MSDSEEFQKLDRLKKTLQTVQKTLLTIAQSKKEARELLKFNSNGQWSFRSKKEAKKGEGMPLSGNYTSNAL